jgi:ribose transport system substrate-binding protein
MKFRFRPLVLFVYFLLLLTFFSTVEIVAAEKIKVGDFEIELGEILTRGPEGQVPVWFTQIQLNDAEKAKIKEGGHKIAYDKLNESEFDDTIGFAIDAMAKELDMEYIYTFNRMDPATQKDNVETILASEPDIISSVSVDPVVSGAIFRKAAEMGVTLVFCSNKAPLKWNEEYKGGLVFYDLAGFGPMLAEKLNVALGGQGKVGYVFHDANFFITNQRDQSFKDSLKNYPGLEIVDERPWDGNPASAESVVSAMITLHPEIQGIYLPWQEAAMPAIAALRSANRGDVKIVTNDVGEITALEMIRGDNIVAMTQCMAWQYGVTVTELGCYSLLGKEIPAECVIVPGLVVTRENIKDAWPVLFNKEIPSALQEALDKRSQ